MDIGRVGRVADLLESMTTPILWITTDNAHYQTQHTQTITLYVV